jgi:hypothetical protein
VPFSDVLDGIYAEISRQHLDATVLGVLRCATRVAA